MAIADVTSIPEPRSYTKGKRRRKTKGLTKEEKAEISRVNGRKSALTPHNAYPKVEALPAVDNAEYDFLVDLYHPNAKYPAELKLATVQAYFTTGGSKAASRLTGVNYKIIDEWRTKSQWWPAAYAKAKKDKQEELDAQLTALIDKAFSAIEDRVLKGDEILGKDGRLMRKKMSGKDLATTGAIMYDKRAMLRGDPTSITARASVTDTLAMLRQEFTQIAKAELDKTVINPLPKK